MSLNEFIKWSIDRGLVTPVEVVLMARSARVQALVKQYIDARKQETNSTY